jgi:hypothetical protein
VTNGNSLTILGRFFGAKKVKVFLEIAAGQRRNVKVTDFRSNASDGDSFLQGIVSNNVLNNLAPGFYDIVVANQLGIATLVGGFTKP